MAIVLLQLPLMEDHSCLNDSLCDQFTFSRITISIFLFSVVLKIKFQKIFLACQGNVLNEFSGSYINLDSLGEGSNWKQDVERFFLTLQSAKFFSISSKSKCFKFEHPTEILFRLDFTGLRVFRHKNNNKINVESP